jgi:uncharacterized protein (TIGR03382 family)
MRRSPYLQSFVAAALAFAVPGDSLGIAGQAGRDGVCQAVTPDTVSAVPGPPLAALLAAGLALGLARGRGGVRRPVRRRRG